LIDAKPGEEDARVSVTHRSVLEGTRLFRGLTPEQLADIAAIWEKRVYQPGEHLLREGEPDDFVYVLVEGVVHLVKNTSFDSAPSRIGELRAGDTIGELKIVDRQPSTASVVAATKVTVVAIDLDVFDRHEALAEARAVVWRNVGQILAERLQRTSITGADAIHRELAESEARAYAGRVMLIMCGSLAVYQLVLAAVALVPAARRPPNTILSFALILWTAIPVLLGLRRSPFSLEAYGLTWRNGWRQAGQALAWTTPLLLVLLLVKIVLIHTVPAMSGRPVFDPAAVFDGRAPNWGFYALAILLYSVHSPIQEFVARAGLQGSLQLFLRVPRGRVSWKAILIANLVFASAHSYLGFWFCAAAFIPGLFWGWLFAWQGSLLGVTVSHIAVGLWGLFVLGLQGVHG
jgi:CRP-like cAMP-binding protein